MKRRSRAFTLIELLVVTAIIGLLIAILLPVLSRAKEKGRSLSCLNKTREIGRATASMFDDLDGRLPYRTAATKYGEAAALLIPYVGGSTNVFDCPSNDGELLPGNADLDIPESDTVIDYIISEYVASYPGKTGRRQNMINDYSLVAVACDTLYDIQYRRQNQWVHKDKVNVGFLDGHSMPMDELQLGLRGVRTTNDFFLERGHDLN